MGWSEKDDKDLVNCIKQSTEKIIKLKDPIIPLRNLIQSCKQIQTKSEIGKKIIDEFGDEMDDKERLARKKKYMSKMKEL